MERIYIGLNGLDIASAKSLTNSRYEKAYFQAMDDDFNTPEALSVLFQMIAEINRIRETNFNLACQLGKLIIRLGNYLGILYSSPDQFLMGDGISAEIKGEIEKLIVERERARADKNWQRADEIRDQLSNMRVVVEDSTSGSSWRIER